MSDFEKEKKKRLEAEWKSRNKIRQRQWASSGASPLQQVLGEDDMAREKLQQAGWSVDLPGEKRRSLIGEAFKDNYWEIIWLLQHYSRGVEEPKRAMHLALKYAKRADANPVRSAQLMQDVERLTALKRAMEEDIKYFKKLK